MAGDLQLATLDNRCRPLCSFQILHLSSPCLCARTLLQHCNVLWCVFDFHRSCCHSVLVQDKVEVLGFHTDTLMAGARESMNFPSETSEFIDQPSVQHDRVVTIPPAPDDSSIASASVAAVGFQTSSSPSVVPREGVSTGMLASAANTQGQSRAPGQQRSRWNDPCFSRLTFDFFNISIQTILLVVFLPVFRDESAHVTLQAWVIGTGAGCVLNHTYKCFRELQSNQLRQAVLTVSLGSEVVGESQTGWRQRFGIQILKWLWRLLDVFFELWIGVGTGIVYTRWKTGQAPHLSWLSTVFLVIAFCRSLLPLILAVFIVMLWFVIRVLLRAWPRGTQANVLSALPTYFFEARETNQASNKEVA